MGRTDDELADAFKVNLDELHAKVAMLPSGAERRWWNRKANQLHDILDEMKERAVGDGMIQPMSGGEPKPL